MFLVMLQAKLTVLGTCDNNFRVINYVNRLANRVVVINRSLFVVEIACQLVVMIVIVVCVGINWLVIIR